MRIANLKRLCGAYGICIHTGVCDGLLSADTCSVWSLLSEQWAYDYFYIGLIIGMGYFISIPSICKYLFIIAVIYFGERLFVRKAVKTDV